MADNTAIDTRVEEPVLEPSTTEETQVTEVDDTPLEEMEVSFDEETDESEEDSEDETTDTEPAESEGESEEDAEPEAEAESSDEESEEENTTSKEDQRLNAEQAFRNREAKRIEREKAKQDQQQKYLEEAEDNRDLALRQLQVDAYNNRVEKHKNKLESGIEKAVANIDLFRTGSVEVKTELARRLEDFEAKHVQYDQNGDPINVNGDVYEYLLKEADSIRTLLNIGARGQTKAKDKAKARTETLPSRAPKEPKTDPDLDAFDEEIAKWS